MFEIRPLHALRVLMLGAVAALIASAPAAVMAQDSTATKAADTPVEAKAAPAAEKSESKVATEKSDAKAHVKGDAKDQEHWLNERLEHMTKRLKLTDDQKTKVRPIMLDEMARGRALRAKYDGKLGTAEGRAAMEQEHKEIWEAADAKLAQVLSADQMNELKKMRAEHMKHRGWSKEKEETEKK